MFDLTASVPDTEAQGLRKKGTGINAFEGTGPRANLEIVRIGVGVESASAAASSEIDQPLGFEHAGWVSEQESIRDRENRSV